MAYKKTFRKKTYRKKYVKKAQPTNTYTGLAMKALKMAVKLKGIINSEKKTINQTVYNSTITTTAGVTLLTGIAQGDTETTRDGNSVLLKSIELKGHLSYGAASGTVVDMFIIEDKKAVNGTSPTFAQAFDGSPSNQNCWKNMAFENRFVYKWHKRFVQDNNIDTIPIDETLYLGDNHHLKWTSTLSTDTENGHYYLYTWSNKAVDPPVVYMDNRLRYYDN